jgi:hypothetical protein
MAQIIGTPRDDRRTGTSVTNSPILLQALLLACSWLALALAWVGDLGFVEHHVLGRAATNADMLHALPLARVLLAAVGVLLLFFAVYLPLLARSGPVQRWLHCSACQRWAILLLPVALIGLVAIYKTIFGVADGLYMLLAKEDSVFEYLTALAYFVACGFAISLSRSLVHDGEYLAGLARAIYALLFLFVGLEEIAYGQRLFGFHNPQFMEHHNLQHEFTLHNMDSMVGVFFKQGPLLLGVFGSLAWLTLCFRPLLPPRWSCALTHSAPPWFTSTYFLAYALYWTSIRLGAQGWLLSEDQEGIELLLSCGFIIFTLDGYLRQRRGARTRAGDWQEPELLARGRSVDAA